MAARCVRTCAEVLAAKDVCSNLCLSLAKEYTKEEEARPSKENNQYGGKMCQNLCG